MAQSATTVTPPSPTPPTNFAFVGATGPNPPNLTKATYADWLDNTKFDSAPPPYFDDAAGGVGSRVAFAANTAALASGTGATSGGTENTYPGTDTAPFDTPNCVGAVPASSSVAHEGAGLEAAATQTYAAGILVPGVRATYLPLEAGAWTEGDPGGPLKTNGVTPALPTSSDAYNKFPRPNAQHASSLSPLTNPALASISPTTATAGASGTDTITFTGTNFTPQSVVWVHHVAIAGAVPRACATTFVSATSLTAAVPKRPTAAPASTLVWVVTGGVVETVTKLLAYT